MSQSLVHLPIHLVFSTKNRVAFLTAEPVRRELETFMTGELHKMNCKSIIQRCVSDHAHLFFHLSKRHALCDVIEEVKKRSSRWVKQRDPTLRLFYWQAGYGAFAVGRAEMEAVEAYIADQDQHHRTTSFQNEFRRLLRAHDVEFDERYVWD